MRHRIKNYNAVKGLTIKPGKIMVFGYVFFNTGESNITITPDGSTPIILVPGQTMDTRNVNTIDVTTYVISFLSENSLATNSEQGTLNITVFERA